MYRFFILSISFYLVLNCTSTLTTNNNTEWLIPVNEVIDGGPGKDGIPSIDNPKFVPASKVNLLAKDDLVIGIKAGTVIRAYPHRILDWHEIVNDLPNQLPIAITYCPLTGSAIGWQRTIGGKITTFGVSGLLYNSNLIPYDRNTNSNWSQMLLKCVNGPLAGTTIQTYPVIETTWETWRKLYPESQILSFDTGFNRDYARYPYGNYKTSNDIFFPVSNRDSRLHPKTRVLGILLRNRIKVYPINHFSEEPQVLHETLEKQNYIIFGSKKWNVGVAYKNQLKNGPGNLIFSVDTSKLPIILKDNLGNQYSIFGEVVEGPNKGDHLLPANGFIAYWFAWSAFYPKADIWNQ